MARTRTYALRKFTNQRRMITSFMIVFVVVAFLLTFAKPAEMFSKGLKMVGIDASPRDIRDVASGLTLVGVGLTMMIVATSFAAVPVVGAGLVLVGAAMAVWGAVKIWNWSKRRKPMEVNIGQTG